MLHFDLAHRLHYLATLCRDLIGREISPASLLAELERLGGRGWIALDEIYRQRIRSPTLAMTPAGAATWLDTARRADAPFDHLVDSLDPSGYRRESAVRGLEGVDSPLALPLLLLRCNDAVLQVRSAAKEALVRRLDAADDATWLASLPLVALLRQRERFEHSVWSPLLRPRLLEARRHALCWQATRLPDSITRHLAFELLIDAGHDDMVAIATAAMADSDGRLALWALTSARIDGDVGRLLAIARRGLGHPLGRIRAESLRLCWNLDRASAIDAARGFLFDPVAVVRTAAEFRLRQHTTIVPLAEWRAAIDAGPPDHAGIAVQALADVAEAEDAGRVRPFLTHRSALVRMAALQAYQRSGAADAPERCRFALRDASSKVVGRALALLRSGPAGLAAADLDDAWRSNRLPPCRGRLASAAADINKWESLLQLLAWLAAGDDQALLLRHVDDWIDGERTRFTPASKAQLARFADALPIVSDALGERRFERLRLALRFA